MARFDVFASDSGLLLDVQSDLLDVLTTRVVVPLIPLDQAPTPARRLNPIFDLDGTQLLMATQFIATVPTSILGDRHSSLSAAQDEITAALDMLFTGF
ncbi:CcdB family protein [uncultured Tateyamaria sp.]|uniref:CcdB family protein n=1 Tax=uncultured Tateyamaria sp. TaxID=455651 RepID=UPI00261EFBB3|nr:CcdB family protein [uncultured Tateyamaria sp.]